jgi:hypothetical protein
VATLPARKLFDFITVEGADDVMEERLTRELQEAKDNPACVQRTGAARRPRQ